MRVTECLEICLVVAIVFHGNFELRSAHNELHVKFSSYFLWSPFDRIQGQFPQINYSKENIMRWF